MEVFHPRAKRAPASVAGPDFLPGVAPKLVIHTIEAPPDRIFVPEPDNYFGHTGWPHATIDTRGIHQHYPIDSGARTLENHPGGVQTNAAHAIQCEVMGAAQFVNRIPNSTLVHLADWLTWCAQQTGAPLTFATFVPFHPNVTRTAQRFSGAEWMAFTGICGHQHVPENSHGDPGDLPVARLRNLMEEDFMSPELSTQLQKLMSITEATNAAMGRIEVTVADPTGGLVHQIEALRQQVAALSA